MFRFLWRIALRRGLLGGDRRWMAVLAVVGAARAFRRLAGSVPEVVYAEELRPGQALIISHHADQHHGDRQPRDGGRR